jgi:sigma-B regulation protein RsbU (phosphoserine phosphatase)
MRLYFRWKLFFGFFGFALFVSGLLVAVLLLEVSRGSLFPGQPALAFEFRQWLHGFLAWALLILGCVSIPPALWIASRLNRPIRRLHEAMHQVSGGKLDARISPLRTYDEFEELIDNFNLMLAGLREREQLLAERARFVETHLQLRIARDIQRSLLPPGPPAVDGFDIAAVCHPAEEVGGDYFDYLPMAGGRLGALVSDVAGHGLGPALVMAATRTCLRSLTAAGQGLEEVLTRANGILHTSTPENCFVTLALAEIDPAARVLRYASCGHSTCYILGRQGDLKARLTSTAPPLGCLPAFEIGPVPVHTLEAGDVVVLLTDGVTETESEENQFFGDQRALDAVRARLDAPAAEMAGAIHRAAQEFRGSRAARDDITALVVKVGPPAA